MEIPSDLPIVERDVVRVVVGDGQDRILLFHTREISAPELGEWWELPGGGIDPGETHVDAAVRELREEAGIIVTPEQVGAPTWRRIGVSPSQRASSATRGRRSGAPRRRCACRRRIRAARL